MSIIYIKLLSVLTINIMETLIIEAEKTLPYICFDPRSEQYLIKGNSFHEDPQLAYEPIFKWIRENIDKIDHKINFTVQIYYFNSASNRMLLKMLRLLEVAKQSGKNINIVWKYDDDECKTDGTIFEKIINIPFKFIKV